VILRIVEAKVCGPHLLHLAFNDGTRKTVNVSALLIGPIFEPLRDPAYFGRVELDRVCGTLAWPNGADFAPEALHELAAVDEPSAV
jgi:hypothetical protein